jgi:uncharacterized membrane protein
MITVAGLTFSITMLTIQLASSQFGPRLLRHLMRDRSTQTVLGIFVSTFIYCLLVLRTVRGTEGAGSVPHLSVALGVVLALISLGTLIYFIHHIAHSLRLETVLAQLTAEAKNSIEHLYPEARRHPGPERQVPQLGRAREIMSAPAVQLHCKSNGYIHRIDLSALLEIASSDDLFLRIEVRPGDFVVSGDTLLSGWPPEQSGARADILRSCFSVGHERTPEQDLAYSSGRIVEIAQRALSPGINDPSTALYCSDRLREILLHLLGREIPAPLRIDEDGSPRIWSEPHDPDEFASETIAAVARHGTSQPELLAALGSIAAELRSRLGGANAPRLSQLMTSIGSSAENCALQYDRQRLKARLGLS